MSKFHHKAIVDSDSSGEDEDPDNYNPVVSGPPSGKRFHRIVDDDSDNDDSGAEVPIQIIPLPPASDEQKAISEAIKNQKNPIADAVAGSGKTTSLGLNCEVNSDKLTLGLLYNRDATNKSRARLAGICPNLVLRTIHSAAGAYYKIPCPDDNGLNYILTNNCTYVGPLFDLIILDEAQDSTPILIRTLRKMIYDINQRRGAQKVQMMVIGDQYQTIYQFRGADSRYLTHANQLFGDLVPGEWVQLKLSQTFRNSIPICDFINGCFLNENRLISNIQSQWYPEYIVGDTFNIGPYINELIDSYLATGKSPDDIAILAYSIAGDRTPVAKITQSLIDLGKPVFKPSNDQATITSQKQRKGKIAVSTILQFKGLEADMVIFVGADSGFYMYNKDAPRDRCPEAVYVALTRAKERLILLHHKSNTPFPFMIMDRLKMFAHVRTI
jgi:hypothetical protein